jgi:hypothetical protein
MYTSLAIPSKRSNIMNKWVLSFCASIVIVLVQVITTQWTWIEHLRQQVELVSQAKNIESDQVRDLMTQLISAKSDAAAAGTQHFVSGVMAAIQSPDHYSEIWHSGYDRGTDVQNYIASLEKEEMYTKGKDE